MRSSFRSPDAPAACSTSCLILSWRIAIRLLSSANDNELSLPIEQSPGSHQRIAGKAQTRLCPLYPFPLLRRLQYRDVIRHRSPTHVEDARELGVLELHTLGRLPHQLHRAHHMHGNAGGADRVALGLQTAGRIDRQLAVLLGPTFLDGARALPARR